MISVETAVLGSFALCFDVSSLTEGSLELYYGCTGDVETVAFNPIRDTYFFGWQEGYDAAAFGVNMGFGYCSAVDLAVASEIRTESVLLEEIGGGGKTNFENEIPRSGSEWDAYFRGKYGDENVVWNFNSIEDIIKDPLRLEGYTADELEKVLGSGWTRDVYARSGGGWKFLKDDISIFYHPGGGRHGGSYYGISAGTIGKIKVVNPDTYIPIPGDKATIIFEMR